MTAGVRIAMRKLTYAEVQELRRREKKYRRSLRKRGYITRTLVDDSGCFAVVMVEEEATGRRGVLRPDGQVCWLDEVRGPGGLAGAAASGASLEPPEGSR